MFEYFERVSHSSINTIKHSSNLKCGTEFDVELTGGEVVRHGIVEVGIVGHPDKGDDIVVVEEVEDFDADGKVAEKPADT